MERLIHGKNTPHPAPGRRACAAFRTVNDVRDTQLKGYGVRVMPSGAKRYFIHSQHRGRRVWKTVADAETVTETEARARARSMLTALRDGGEPDAEDPGEVLFEQLAEEVFRPIRPPLETENSQDESRLPSPADSPLLPGTCHRGDNPRGRAGVVPLSPRDARGREPLGADPVGDHAAGGSLGSPAG